MEKRKFVPRMLPWLLVVQLGAIALPVWAASAGALPVLAARLPSQPFTCPVSGTATRPDVVFRGRPGVLLFLGHDGTRPSELELFLGRMQQQFAPWMRWGAVLPGGPGTQSEALARLGGEGPLRVDQYWSDPEGTWRKSFLVSGLPAAVLVNESGYVTARQIRFSAESEQGFLRALERLVISSRLTGGPLRDFKLEESLSGALTTFADLPHRDYTLLLSVKSDCEPCLEELRLLSGVGLEHPGRVVLVTIDHDEPGPATELPPAPASQVWCDLNLKDPGRRYAERYAIVGVPTLLVVDRRGTIVLARHGFEPGEADELSGELEALLGRTAPPDDGEERLAEFLRIRTEALGLLGSGRAGMAAFFLERALELQPELYTVQLPLAQAYLAAGKPREAARAYARYLAAEPRACDRTAVLSGLKALAATPRRRSEVPSSP